MRANKQSIGQRLRSARLQLGVTQLEFALALETAPNHICQIERGRCVPGGKLLRGMRVEFGININWLLTGVQDAAATSVLTQELHALVAHYRRADPRGKEILKATARFMARGADQSAALHPRP
ncbi:helix-turn-helix domain-containing protein [Herbaspirillum sp. NPDC087042]|uniref:helix-turn-helix domain-containing protein n=1 Tax=Herbaspirillum sp. NPDC087042 TaxID=3364004 RepID=UPI0038057448